MVLKPDNETQSRTDDVVWTNHLDLGCWAPEIAEYPDSKKVGVLAEFSSQGDGKPTVMRYIIRNQAGMADYWEGE